MHSLGNDFVIIVGIEESLSISNSLAKKIADRQRGIGCDQILLVNRCNDGGNLFNFQIFNQDGSESYQCGNGARCVARLLHDRGFSHHGKIILQTALDKMLCKVSPTTVSVGLGVPRFAPHEIPMLATRRRKVYSVKHNGASVDFSALSLGNPHAVISVSDIHTAAVNEVGSYLESHPKFPQKTNVGFMQIESADSIYLRVYERGVGETFACGSGASAAVVAGRNLGVLNDSVTVIMRAGELGVTWKGKRHRVELSGPTSYVFKGEICQQLM